MCLLLLLFVGCSLLPRVVVCLLFECWCFVIWRLLFVGCQLFVDVGCDVFCCFILGVRL